MRAQRLYVAAPLTLCGRLLAGDLQDAPTHRQ